MQGASIQVMADAGGPATGVLSRAACAQPAAIEIICGKDRLITSCGWSPEATGAQAFRLTPPPRPCRSATARPDGRCRASRPRPWDPG
ncbi:heparinase II/III family protein [Caulobacter sp. B11]|uniref:heparinase II/III domain-containing protein n=1 Tax=Caulobacter sp. B11 TaxID=2048899 RepID=UPI0026F44D2F|nr:heparinase II/III family protein [Caulobacter sp. B11]